MNRHGTKDMLCICYIIPVKKLEAGYKWAVAAVQ